MKKISAVACGVLLLFGGLGAAAHAQKEKSASVLRVKGADSMAARISVLAKLFMKTEKNIKVDVEKGGLVDQGIAALLDNQADVVMASRKITDQEDEAANRKGVELVERLVGYGGIVIVVNPSNPVTALTLDQTRKIFTGELTNWKQVGGPDLPILVFRAGEKHPGTMVFLQDEVLTGAPITKLADVQPGFPAVMAKVSQAREGIGYVRVRDAFETSASFEHKIKALKIKRKTATAAVMPSRATVTDGSYPIRRPYYLYYRSTAGSDVQKFVDFVVGRGWGSEG